MKAQLIILENLLTDTKYILPKKWRILLCPSPAEYSFSNLICIVLTCMDSFVSILIHLAIRVENSTDPNQMASAGPGLFCERK